MQNDSEVIKLPLREQVGKAMIGWYRQDPDISAYDMADRIIAMVTSQAFGPHDADEDGNCMTCGERHKGDRCPKHRIGITDEMVTRGANTSSTGRQDDLQYRERIRRILDAALNG